MMKHLLALLGLGSLTEPGKAKIEGVSLDTYRQPSSAMSLVIYSDYGSKETLNLPKPTEADVIRWMDSLDWSQFHQVILTYGGEETDYLEVGGSLNPSDGLSSIVSVGGTQYVPKKEPPSVEHMKALIISYYRNDDQWKQVFKQ